MGDVHKVLFHPLSSWKKYKQMRIEHFLLNETFMQQQYYWLASKLKPDTTVIDIGANIGDSTIFFAQFENVKKVYAYEPFPSAYKRLRANIKKIRYREIRKKITTINKAITYLDEKKMLPAEQKDDFGASYQKVKSGSEEIEGITLYSALKGLVNVAIKCDCEGGEQTIFNNANLSNVYAIQIECHTWDNIDLKITLKRKGFRVAIKHPGEDTVNSMLYAERK